MQRLMVLSGNIAALLGMFCCVIAGLSRLGGSYYVPGGIEVLSMFVLGTGLMVYACLTKLELLIRCGTICSAEAPD